LMQVSPLIPAHLPQISVLLIIPADGARTDQLYS
jgi:hypothetical protein